MKMLLLISYISAGVLFVLTTVGRSDEIHHHAGQSPAVDRFYSTWHMPDVPASSCCNQLDCYPTEAHMSNGHWVAKQRETGGWMRVPDKKIEYNRDNPDGQSHVCATPEGIVLCFIAGGGT